MKPISGRFCLSKYFHTFHSRCIYALPLVHATYYYCYYIIRLALRMQFAPKPNLFFSSTIYVNISSYEYYVYLL